MAQPDQKQLAAYYRNTFGFDPEALTDEQKKQLTEAVTRIENAQGRPYVAKNGKIVLNDDLQRLQTVGIPASTARALSLWRHYSAGVKPDELDAERMKKAGVPADQIERINGERAADFKQRAANAYAMWAVPDPQPETKKKPADIVMEPEEVTAAPPSAPAMPQQQAPPSGAAVPLAAEAPVPIEEKPIGPTGPGGD